MQRFTTAITLVAILSFIAIGTDALSRVYEKHALAAASGILAQVSISENATRDITSTETAASTDTSAAIGFKEGEIEQLCTERKKEAAALGKGASEQTTQQFSGQNITQKNKCVAALFDPKSAAAQSPAPGTDPLKNPDAYKCVGEATIVTISSAGAGQMLSAPDRVHDSPLGTCFTSFCDSLDPPVCGVAKQFSGAQALQGWAAVPGVAESLTSQQSAGIAALRPEQAVIDAAFSDPQASTRNLDAVADAAAQTARQGGQLPRPPIPPAGGASGQLPIPPMPPGETGGLSGFPIPPIPPPDGASSDRYGPPPSGEVPWVTGSTFSAHPAPTVFDPSGNYETSASGPQSVSQIPASDSAIRTSTPDSLSAVQHEMGTSARHLPVERSGGMVTYPDGSTQYITGSMGDANSVMTPASDTLDAADAGGPGTTGVLMHTHPLSSIFENNPAQAAAVLSGDQAPPTSPPSFADVRNNITLTALSKEGTTMSGQVVDPSGVWTYSLDKTSPNGQAFLNDYKETVWSATTGLEGEARIAARDAAEVSLAEKYTPMTFIDRSGVLADKDPYFFNDPASRQVLITAYQSLGIKLTYTPFPPAGTGTR